MGKYEVGVLGGFTGKVGTVVGSNWRGIEYMRHKGKKSKKPPTEAQLEQQAKFGLGVSFTSTINELLMKSFRGDDKKTGANTALSLLLFTAITGTYPAFDIDYSQVLVSKGKRPKADLPVATANGSGAIGYTWSDNALVTADYQLDKTVLVVHCPDLKESIFVIGGAARPTETDSISVPNFIGKQVHTWFAFVSPDGQSFSGSTYTGALTVS
jgi:hypothetical protein